MSFKPVFADRSAPGPRTQRARDGSVLRWGEADTPVPQGVIGPGTPALVTVAVSPVRPGHVVTVEYRVNGGPIRQAKAGLVPGVPQANARLFRALLPGQPGGLVDFLPVLRFGGQPISPGLTELPDCPRYQVGGGTASVADVGSSTNLRIESTGEPRWEWNTKFLWAGTIGIRKEVVGDLPDGLRINWYFTEGRFVGPEHEGIVLPGAGDFMRIREDGIGIVDVTMLMETRTGARLYCRYGGIFDLGPDGFARAVRNEFDAFPTFVTAPTYTTEAKELSWLNRTQCLGLGRVDTKAMRIEADVYAVDVGDRKRAS